ncbi:unnamed protein product [Kuraishia capsulata CBS 1993]|uniref:Translation initiation factor eIF2B subunit epsilon n=1 Tax=Kuraishia capsulata CBS 1993 TaxID=1382522 RepID=W6MUH3_9ASCO|nr:uncharacterized protein KUCA_T00005270001 [Kuraishia capsulata CBS 1993]CDK29282.1 unnamed protein product [Kuraishia capsulata CBS 1993]
MPPKSSRKASGTHVEEDEPALQAIVLTDSFQTRFMPLTSVRPRCLLPLANVPLIEYTLEFLAQANVSEVYLMCSAHGDQIQSYIDESKWVSSSSPFKKIQTVMSLESKSVGDAMRDVDSRGLITNDFVLVSGDVITNLELDKVVAAHRARRIADKDHIVTMVLTEASPLHRTRSHVEPSCFILDKTSSRCLYFQDIPAVSGAKSAVSIDPEILEDVGEFEIRNDLIDCHVDICSPAVPAIFQENFDYQSLRSDFIKGVLSSDLLKKNIYAHVTKDDYAARVESWQTYDAVSQDVLERWCYPIAPDRNLLDDQTYTHESKHIYKEEGVILSQSCKIVSCVAIGSETFIGDGTKVTSSVIGRNCTIGKNVIIEHSYIWDGAVVGDGCVIRHAIIAANTEVRPNVMVDSGSVIGFEVVVDENVIVPNNTKIVKVPVQKLTDSMITSLDSEDESSENDESDISEDESHKERPTSATHDPSVVGQNGVGFLYESDTEDEDDSANGAVYNGIVYQMKGLNMSDVSIASTVVAGQLNMRRKKRTQSINSAYTMTDEEYDDEEEFGKEAIATVERAMENNHDIDTALLELNTLRMSMNVTYHEVRLATCSAMTKRVEHFIETQTLGVKEATLKVFNQWGSLFKRQVFELEDQVDLLQILQKACEDFKSADTGASVLMLSLNVLYEEDIVEEEQIYQWWDGAKAKGLGEFGSKAGKWVEWLREAESESESDED